MTLSSQRQAGCVFAVAAYQGFNRLARRLGKQPKFCHLISIENRYSASCQRAF